MRKTLKFSNTFVRTATVIGGYVGSALMGKARIKDRHQRLSFFSHNIGNYTRRALDIFNFEVELVGYDPELMKKQNFLMVSNHMSYMDIFLLSAHQPCVFVTSVDMGQTAILGDICELGGSIFVERRHRNHIGRDLKVMSETLKAGHNVVIYPEGTSTNGERILPFKKSLLMSAVESGRDIMPVVVKYTEIDGEPFSLANRDRLCWYGDMGFFPHFMGLMKTKKVKAELHFLEPIKVTPESTRHDLADQAYAAISSVYGNPLGVDQSASNLAGTQPKPKAAASFADAPQASI